MKTKCFFVILSVLLGSWSASATGRTDNATDLSIENTYLKEMLSEHAVAQSMESKDYMIAAFIAANQNKFSAMDMMQIRGQLQNMTPAQLMAVNSVNYKSPTVSLLLSIFLGGLGIDRFYVGDTGLGILKLLTGGGFGVWWLIDLFVISGRTRTNNMKEFVKTGYSTKMYLSPGGN